MTRPAWLTLPRGIAAQIAMLIVAALAVTHAIATVAFLLERQLLDESRRGGGPGEIVSLARLIEAASNPEQRRDIIATAERGFASLQIHAIDTAPTFAPQDDRLLERIRRELGPGSRIGWVADAATPRQLAVLYPNGGGFTAAVPQPPQRPPLGPFFVTLLFLAVSVPLFGWWAARALTAPLRGFANAAEAFSLDAEPAPLSERGPDELRAALRAFNRMQLRIRAMAEDRNRMLAAVGHDLRTPITRLRLRAEFIADAVLRGQVLRDLDQMNAMVESAISFLRGGPVAEGVRTDLPSLLQTVCDEFADLGHDVVYRGPERLALRVRRDELSRAVANLVANAVRHGSHVIVVLEAAGSGAVIEVEDDGPGIPEADKAAMLEPFVRGDAARAAPGFGLGLSIARSVAESHGGRLVLSDRSPSGLVARIELAGETDTTH